MFDMTSGALWYETKMHELIFITQAGTKDLDKLVSETKELGWHFVGDPREAVKKMITRLETEGLIRDDEKNYALTEKGKREVERYRKMSDLQF